MKKFTIIILVFVFPITAFTQKWELLFADDSTGISYYYDMKRTRKKSSFIETWIKEVRMVDSLNLKKSNNSCSDCKSIDSLKREFFSVAISHESYDCSTLKMIIYSRTEFDSTGKTIYENVHRKPFYFELEQTGIGFIILSKLCTQRR